MVDEIKSYEEAGKIVSKVRSDASKMIQNGLPILDLVEFVESEILKSGAGIAFPCNVSINEIELNQRIIDASAAGLEAAISTVRAGVKVCDVGRAVEEAIAEYNLNPVRNLSGHSLEHWNLHAGISVPNYDNNDPTILEEGQAVAIEPFATNGEGIVNDCPYAYIFSFLQSKPFRMKNTQRMLQHIEKNYRYLPFSGRWLTENFNEHRVNSGLKQLGDAMAIYPYAALKERTGAWVSQKEHTLIVESDGCNITTL